MWLPMRQATCLGWVKPAQGMKALGSLALGREGWQAKAVWRVMVKAMGRIGQWANRAAATHSCCCRSC